MQTKRRAAPDLDQKPEHLSRLSQSPEGQRRALPERKSPDRSSASAGSGLLRELRETPRHLD